MTCHLLSTYYVPGIHFTEKKSGAQTLLRENWSVLALEREGPFYLYLRHIAKRGNKHIYIHVNVLTDRQHGFTWL